MCQLGVGKVERVTCGGSVSDKSVSLLVVGTARYSTVHFAQLKSVLHVTESGYTFC